MGGGGNSTWWNSTRIIFRPPVPDPPPPVLDPLCRTPPPPVPDPPPPVPDPPSPVPDTPPPVPDTLLLCQTPLPLCQTPLPPVPDTPSPHHVAGSDARDHPGPITGLPSVFNHRVGGSGPFPRTSLVCVCVCVCVCIFCKSHSLQARRGFVATCWKERTREPSARPPGHPVETTWQRRVSTRQPAFGIAKVRGVSSLRQWNWDQPVGLRCTLRC